MKINNVSNCPGIVIVILLKINAKWHLFKVNVSGQITLVDHWLVKMLLEVMILLLNANNLWIYVQQKMMEGAKWSFIVKIKKIKVTVKVHKIQVGKNAVGWVVKNNV